MIRLVHLLDSADYHQPQEFHQHADDMEEVLSLLTKLMPNNYMHL